MVFLRSDLELVLQQVVANGMLDSAPLAKPAAASKSVSLTGPAGEDALAIEALRDAILATNDLDVINGWLDEDLDTLPSDPEESAALAWNLERLITAARKAAELQTEASAGAPELESPAQPVSGADPLLLNDARAKLFAAGGDPRLKPFESWADLRASLGEQQRVVDLVAAYGMHEALASAATAADKRAIATLLVLGSIDLNGNGTIDAAEIAPADRLDFMQATGLYAGGSLAGLNLVDLRLAAPELAKELLTASAELVLESEIETLQGAGRSDSADKSAAASGQAVAISNGSSTVPAAVDAGVPADLRASGAPDGPAVDARQQFIRLGLDGRAVPDDEGGITFGAATLDLVLAGSAEADVLVGSAGKDTIKGNAGDDNLSGGGGDDSISGDGGNDLVRGDDGDDAIAGGSGDDLIEGGAGSDQADGEEGNDVIFADDEDSAVAGGEGDDIVVAETGHGHRTSGGKGWDWVTYRHGQYGDNDDDSGEVDLEEVEGLSGSNESDHLRGDDRDGAAMAAGNALTNVAIVAGLQELLDGTLSVAGVSSYADGNIILGGAGSDSIEGGGGNDLIDGDLTLQVRVVVDSNANGLQDSEVLWVSSLADLENDDFADVVNASHLLIVREILAAGDNTDVDTAVFSGQRKEYEVDITGSVTTVAHRQLDEAGSIITGSTGADGIDRLTRIERLQFRDEVLVLTRGSGDTYAWQLPVAVAAAVAAMDGEDSSGSGGNGSPDAGCDDIAGSGLIEQLASADLSADLARLLDDGSDGAPYELSSDMLLAPNLQLQDISGSGSATLDIGGIDWLLGADGDMFDFGDLTTASDTAYAGTAAMVDAAVIEAVTAELLFDSYNVELVGAYDLIPSEYVL
jgi:Ca2+-binding RTX toxin-like protein